MKLELERDWINLEAENIQDKIYIYNLVKNASKEFQELAEIDGKNGSYPWNEYYDGGELDEEKSEPIRDVYEIQGLRMRNYNIN